MVEDEYREGRPDSKYLNHVSLKKLACQTYHRSDPNLSWGAEELGGGEAGWSPNPLALAKDEERRLPISIA